MVRIVLTTLFYCLFNNSYFSNDYFLNAPLSCVLLAPFVYSFDKLACFVSETQFCNTETIISQLIFLLLEIPNSLLSYMYQFLVYVSLFIYKTKPCISISVKHLYPAVCFHQNIYKLTFLYSIYLSSYLSKLVLWEYCKNIFWSCLSLSHSFSKIYPSLLPILLCVL